MIKSDTIRRAGKGRKEKKTLLVVIINGNRSTGQSRIRYNRVRGVARRLYGHTAVPAARRRDRYAQRRRVTGRPADGGEGRSGVGAAAVE